MKLFPQTRMKRRWIISSIFTIGSFLGLIISVGILLLLAKFHEELSEYWLKSLDQGIQNSLHQMASPPLTTFMFTLTMLGDILGLIIVAFLGGLGLLLARRWYEGASLLVAIVGAATLNQAAKYGFHRPRPIVTWALIREDGYSFPSGHAMMSLIFYGIVAYLLFRLLSRLPRLRILMVIVLLVLIGGIGLSRVYLGVHYPSDVLAGFLASGIWLLCVIGVTEITRWLYASLHHSTRAL